MSSLFFLGSENIRSAGDNRIPTSTELIVIPAGEIFQDDFMLKQNRLIKSVKIINNDDSNTILYRLHSKNAVQNQIPPNSDNSFDEWATFIQIDNTGGTVDALLEVDLAKSEDAKRIEGS